MKFFNFIFLAIIVFAAFMIGARNGMGPWAGIGMLVLVVLFYIYKSIPQIFAANGRKLFMQGRFDEAKHWFGRAVGTNRANAYIKLEYSYVLLRTGDVEKAEQLVTSVLGNRIVDTKLRGKAIIQRCMCYFKRDNLDEAMEDAMELYNDGYRSISLYGMIGYFKIYQDPMSEDTMSFCREAYDYADDDRDIRDNMLICYYNRGEYEKAKEISDKVLEAEPMFVEAWYHGAQVDYELGLYEDAKKKLDRIPECHRSYMTTVPEEDVEKLTEMVDQKLGGRA